MAPPSSGIIILLVLYLVNASGGTTVRVVTDLTSEEDRRSLVFAARRVAQAYLTNDTTADRVHFLVGELILQGSSGSLRNVTLIGLSDGETTDEEFVITDGLMFAGDGLLEELNATTSSDLREKGYFDDLDLSPMTLFTLFLECIGTFVGLSWGAYSTVTG